MSIIHKSMVVMHSQGSSKDAYPAMRKIIKYILKVKIFIITKNID